MTLPVITLIIIIVGFLYLGCKAKRGYDSVYKLPGER
jgi:ABC-type polysaccharide transport system permease subunit